MRRPFRLLVLGFAWLGCAGAALGHVGFENSTEIHVQSERMRVVVKMAVEMTWMLLGDRVPQFDDEEGRKQMVQLLFEESSKLLEVTADGEVMVLRKIDAGFNQDGAAEFTLDYDRPTKWPVTVKALFFRTLGPRSNGTMSAFDESAGPVTEDAEPLAGKVIVRADPELTFYPAKCGPGIAGPLPVAEPVGLVRYFLLGIEHILTGYDHLLFLFALVLACRSVRPMLIIITAFTLAHSITLALAAMDLVKLPSLWVESFIALSIVFVGVENLFLKVEPRRRAVLTFAFGLVHGLGFASALKGIGLGSNGQSIMGPLITFNLGVETGQLTLVALVLPILLKLRKRSDFEKYAMPVMSGIVIVMGGIWFIQRVSGGG